MSNINPDALCENCRHFKKEQPGECRKYAPRGKSKWTLVTKTDWCSEFEKTEETSTREQPKDAFPASDLPNQNAKKPKSLEDVASGKEIIE